MRFISHSLLGLLGLPAALLPGPSPLHSQELGVSYTVAGSGHPELPSPRGLKAHMLMEFNPDWWVDVSFNRSTDETVKDTRVCRSYAPPVLCNTEETRTSVSLSGVRVGVLRALRSGGRFRMGAGGGISFNTVDGQGQGESGLRADLLLPNGGQIGAFGTLLLAFTPLPSFPVTVMGGLNLHWVKFSLCSGEDPPQYDPFCTPDSFREVEVGFSFPFR